MTERMTGQSHEELAYERTDAPADKVAAVLGAFLLLLVLAGVAAWALWQESKAPAQSPEPTAAPRPVAPNEPRLQTAPVADLAVLRAREERLLHASGFDAATGSVHIPIEQAMTLLVMRAQKAGRQP